LIAPNVFKGYYELPIALVATAAVVSDALRRDLFSGPEWSVGWLICLMYLVGLTGYTAYGIKTSQGHNRVAVRNFYGGMRVSDSGTGIEAIRTLTHGTINHG